MLNNSLASSDGSWNVSFEHNIKELNVIDPIRRFGCIIHNAEHWSIVCGVVNDSFFDRHRAQRRNYVLRGPKQ